MKENIKTLLRIGGLVLLIIGTAGLLLNEIILDHSTTRTLIFAAVNIAGLVGMAVSHFAIRTE